MLGLTSAAINSHFTALYNKTVGEGFLQTLQQLLSESLDPTCKKLSLQHLLFPAADVGI